MSKVLKGYRGLGVRQAMNVQQKTGIAIEAWVERDGGSGP